MHVKRTPRTCLSSVYIYSINMYPCTSAVSLSSVYIHSINMYPCLSAVSLSLCLSGAVAAGHQQVVRRSGSWSPAGRLSVSVRRSGSWSPAGRQAQWQLVTSRSLKVVSFSLPLLS